MYKIHCDLCNRIMERRLRCALTEDGKNYRISITVSDARDAHTTLDVCDVCLERLMNLDKQQRQ